MTRVPELLDKMDVAENFFAADKDLMPQEIFDMIKTQRALLNEARQAFGENISPFQFEGYEVPDVLTKPF
jgi:hypothetical protein